MICYITTVTSANNHPMLQIWQACHDPIPVIISVLRNSILLRSTISKLTHGESKGERHPVTDRPHQHHWKCWQCSCGGDHCCYCPAIWTDYLYWSHWSLSLCCRRINCDIFIKMPELATIRIHFYKCNNCGRYLSRLGIRHSPCHSVNLLGAQFFNYWDLFVQLLYQNTPEWVVFRDCAVCPH